MPNGIERRVRWVEYRRNREVFSPVSLIEARRCIKNNLIMQKDITGVLPRNVYEERIKETLADRRSYPITVMMVDVNGLKNINDMYGHIIGDLALKEVAEALIDSVREKDIVGRYGGDEFILLMRSLDEKKAKKIRARIREEIGKRNTKGYNFIISVAIGSQTFRGTGSDYETSVRRADIKMYKDKRRIKRKLET